MNWFKGEDYRLQVYSAKSGITIGHSIGKEKRLIKMLEMQGWKHKRGNWTKGDYIAYMVPNRYGRSLMHFLFIQGIEYEF